MVPAMKRRSYVWSDGREMTVAEMVRHLEAYRAQRETQGLPFDEGQADILRRVAQPVLDDTTLSTAARASIAVELAEALGAHVRVTFTREGGGIEFLSAVAKGRAGIWE